MTSYKVNATLTVEVANSTGDDSATIQAAVDAGLKELPGVAQRYGFRITDADATVEPAG
jgi:hypothetical protein